MQLVALGRSIGTLIGLSVLLIACEVGPSIPQATPETRAGLLAQPEAQQRHTPVTALYPRIGRMVLTTAIDAGEAPVEELTTVPGNAETIYLAVGIVEMPAGTTLTAVWLHNDAELSRSDRAITEPVREPRWLAFPLRPTSPLPGGEYVVRLLVNGQMFDSLVFNVSGGAGGMPATAESTQLAFIAALPADGGTVDPRSLFPPDTTQVVAVLTDPPAATGAELTSRWYYNEGILAEIPPDELVTPSIRTFTLRSDQPLPAGFYRVEVLIDGQVAASGQFLVQGAPPATSQASIEDFAVVSAIDPATQAPTGASIAQVEAPATVYAAALVRDLGPNDLLEIVWVRNDVEVARFPITGLRLDYNWVSLPYEIPAQPDESTVVYRAIVVLNGTPVRDHSLTVQ
jgi:hypothetical protein